MKFQSTKILNNKNNPEKQRTKRKVEQHTSQIQVYYKMMVIKKHSIEINTDKHKINETQNKHKINETELRAPK